MFAEVENSREQETIKWIIQIFHYNGSLFHKLKPQRFRLALTHENGIILKHVNDLHGESANRRSRISGFESLGCPSRLLGGDVRRARNRRD